MHRIYDAPPLIEALCELNFDPKIDWDMTIPGLFYEKIKTDYPLKEQKNVLGINLGQAKMAAGNPQATPGISPLTSSARMIFKTADKLGVLQVSPDIFAINKLPVYPGWPVFRQTILKSISAYREVTSDRKPIGINLRYINRVKFSGKQFELDHFFNILPQVPADSGGPIVKYLMSTQIASEAPKGFLSITSTAENPTEGSSFIFDFQIVSRGGDVPQFDKLESWLDLAHKKISTAFEGAFKQKTHKEIFKEKTL